MIGFATLNDEGLDADNEDGLGNIFSDDSGRSSLDRTNIFDKGYCCPMTKESKNTLIFKSIDKLIETNVELATALIRALSLFGSGGGGGGSSKVKELKIRVGFLDSKMNNLDFKIDLAATQTILKIIYESHDEVK